MNGRDYETAHEAIARDVRLLSLLEKINREHAAAIEAMHTEMAEVRDGLVALSNRIEAVMRVVNARTESLT